MSKEPAVTIPYPADEGVTFLKNTVAYFLFNKTRRLHFPNLFCQETLHVLGSSFAHHQEFFTVH
jgi:hypothetical protein